MSHTITKYDAIILNRHAKRGDALELSRTLDILAQRETPNGMDRADILLLAKDETGDNVIHSACAFGNKSELPHQTKVSNQTITDSCLQTSSTSFTDSTTSPSSPASSAQLSTPETTWATPQSTLPR